MVLHLHSAFTMYQVNPLNTNARYSHGVLLYHYCLVLSYGSRYRLGSLRHGAIITACVKAICAFCSALLTSAQGRL